MKHALVRTSLILIFVLLSLFLLARFGHQQALAQVDAGGHRTDYKRPIRAGDAPDGNPHYHITVCEGTTGPAGFVWKDPLKLGKGTAKVDNEERVPAGSSPKSGGESHGNDDSAVIFGKNIGDGELKITFTPENGAKKTIHLTVHVIKCDSANEGHRGVASATSPEKEKKK